MRQLLRKLFFWDSPAKGVFFALTFFFVVSSLWFTLFQMIWLSDCGLIQLNIMYEQIDREGQVWAVVELLITLYSLIVFCRALWLLVVNCRSGRKYLPLFCALGSMALWLCGGLFCLVTFLYSFRLFNFFLLGEIGGAVHAFLPSRMLGLAYLGAVLCMVVGGFFAVKSFVSAEGKLLRTAACKAGVVLWGVFWVAYLVFLGMALVQSRNVARTRAFLEQRFGHPLTADGLREFYSKKGPTDADFWKRLEEASGKLPSKLTIGDKTSEYWNRRLPETLKPEVLSAFDDYCKANGDALLEMEKCFESIPPLPSYAFEEGNLINTMLVNASPCRRFVALELSRMRVFLKRQDKGEALRAYQRIDNCAVSLQHTPFLIGGLVCLAVEGFRLDAIERLLESRMLSDDDLQRLSADLDALEERVPVLQHQAMYSEATFGQDVLWALERGKAHEMPIAFGDLRFFYPQLWFHAALDKEYILRQYLVEDFSHMPATSSRTGSGRRHTPKGFGDKLIANAAYVFSRMLVPGLQQAGNKFNGMTARARAMKALLKADAYRLEHGDYPETLADLPTDPFTGNLMLYRYGDVELHEYVLSTPESFNEDEEEEEKRLELMPQTKTARAVQIWSVGPNGVDEGGRHDLHVDGKDDFSARIRLE